VSDHVLIGCVPVGIASAECTKEWTSSSHLPVSLYSWEWQKTGPQVNTRMGF